MQFYPADWRKDPQLQMCRMSTQGIWINLLCLMWEAETEGEITGKLHELCRIIGCEETEFKKFYVDIKRHNFGDIVGDVTDANAEITIICRRMKKVFLERESGKERQKRFRDKHSNEDVTPYSSSSTSSSTSKHFIEPTILEISEQITKKNYKNITADRFVNFYGSKGWMVGKNKMTDWRKALARAENWEVPSGVGNQTTKIKLFPISGKTCSKQECKMPAVFKDSSGNYDHYYCGDHMPVEVQEKYTW